MSAESARSLRAILDEHTAPAAEDLFDRREGNVVQCHACATSA